MSPSENAEYEWDPVYRNSRKEMVVISILFLIFMTWVVGVSFYLGEEDSFLSRFFEDPRQALVFGMPSWVFYGVLLPWLAVNGLAVWFCFFFMKDDALEAESDSADPATDSPANFVSSSNEGPSRGSADTGEGQ